jgi:cytochrome P450 family 6
VAQAFGFLAAGFETSSSTMSFALYELAVQPNLQHRLRTEITQVLSKHNGEVTYDAVQEMSYLDMVVSGEVTQAGYLYRGLSVPDKFCPCYSFFGITVAASKY